MVTSRIRFVAAVVLTGLASGLIGGLTSELSHLIEVCAFGVPFSSSTTGVGKSLCGDASSRRLWVLSLRA